VAAAAILHRRSTAGAALLIAEPMANWWSRRNTATDVVTHVMAHLAEDVAYGSGVLAGCLRDRTGAPLRPRMRRVRVRLRG
jgi:hypothetical protein